MPEHAWRKALPIPIGAAIALVLGLNLHFSGFFDPAAGAEDPYLEALATHLQDNGARFYGAYWCPACQKQKALFTASADRLPYVECTPGGRDGPRARRLPHSEHPGISDVDHRRAALHRGGGRRAAWPCVELQLEPDDAGNSTGGVSRNAASKQTTQGIRPEDR